LSELLDSILIFSQDGSEPKTFNTTMIDCGAICRDIAQESAARIGTKYQLKASIADNCGMAMMTETLFGRVRINKKSYGVRNLLQREINKMSIKQKQFRAACDNTFLTNVLAG
jgi:stalled ribosome alternative rescue factor ArfA